jgi:hypothetical protein
MKLDLVSFDLLFLIFGSGNAKFQNIAKVWPEIVISSIYKNINTILK